MEPSHVILLAFIAGVVLVPLAWEYADLRASAGLSRRAALGTVALVAPSLAVGMAFSLPLAANPAAQWPLTVIATVMVYSLGVRKVVRDRAVPEPGT